MSQVGLTMTGGAETPASRPPGKKHSKVAVLVALGIVGAIVLAVLTAVYLLLFSSAPDYEGDGHGSVQVTIAPGSSIPQMGQTLEHADVVKSAQAFVDEASDDARARSIHAGSYNMRLQMSASAALDLLVNPANAVGAVLVPEGKRASEVAVIASQGTGIPVAQFVDVMKHPAALELPTWSNGDVEGFLFPASYNFTKEATATTVLKAMVDKFKEQATQLNLERSAAALGKTPYDVVKIASLIQAEGELSDYGKISRVIYNRLDCTWSACNEVPVTTEKVKRLQFDSTLNYALGTSNLNLSKEQLTSNGPFNTNLQAGLPPTPINNPGSTALEAALAPEAGKWLYFVSVPGFTRFSSNFAEQQKAEKEYRSR
jgi:UPF0755 protein